MSLLNILQEEGVKKWLEAKLEKNDKVWTPVSKWLFQISSQKTTREQEKKKERVIDLIHTNADFPALLNYVRDYSIAKDQFQETELTPSKWSCLLLYDMRIVDQALALPSWASPQFKKRFESNFLPVEKYFSGKITGMKDLYDLLELALFLVSRIAKPGVRGELQRLSENKLDFDSISERINIWLTDFHGVLWEVYKASDISSEIKNHRSQFLSQDKLEKWVIEESYALRLRFYDASPIPKFATFNRLWYSISLGKRKEMWQNLRDKWIEMNLPDYKNDWWHPFFVRWTNGDDEWWDAVQKHKEFKEWRETTNPRNVPQGMEKVFWEEFFMGNVRILALFPSKFGPSTAGIPLWIKTLILCDFTGKIAGISNAYNLQHTTSLHTSEIMEKANEYGALLFGHNKLIPLYPPFTTKSYAEFSLYEHAEQECAELVEEVSEKWLLNPQAWKFVFDETYFFDVEFLSIDFFKYWRTFKQAMEHYPLIYEDEAASIAIMSTRTNKKKASRIAELSKSAKEEGEFFGLNWRWRRLFRPSKIGFLDDFMEEIGILAEYIDTQMKIGDSSGCELPSSFVGRFKEISESWENSLEEILVVNYDIEVLLSSTIKYLGKVIKTKKFNEGFGTMVLRQLGMFFQEEIGKALDNLNLSKQGDNWDEIEGHILLVQNSLKTIFERTKYHAHLANFVFCNMANFYSSLISFQNQLRFDIDIDTWVPLKRPPHKDTMEILFEKLRGYVSEIDSIAIADDTRKKLFLAFIKITTRLSGAQLPYDYLPHVKFVDMIENFKIETEKEREHRSVLMKYPLSSLQKWVDSVEFRDDIEYSMFDSDEKYVILKIPKETPEDDRILVYLFIHETMHIFFSHKNKGDEDEYLKSAMRVFPDAPKEEFKKFEEDVNVNAAIHIAVVFNSIRIHTEIFPESEDFFGTAQPYAQFEQWVLDNSERIEEFLRSWGLLYEFILPQEGEEQDWTVWDEEEERLIVTQRRLFYALGNFSKRILSTIQWEPEFMEYYQTNTTVDSVVKDILELLEPLSKIQPFRIPLEVRDILFPRRYLEDENDPLCVPAFVKSPNPPNFVDFITEACEALSTKVRNNCKARDMWIKRKLFYLRQAVIDERNIQIIRYDPSTLPPTLGFKKKCRIVLGYQIDRDINDESPMTLRKRPKQIWQLSRNELTLWNAFLDIFNPKQFKENAVMTEEGIKSVDPSLFTSEYWDEYSLLAQTPQQSLWYLERQQDLKWKATKYTIGMKIADDCIIEPSTVFTKHEDIRQRIHFSAGDEDELRELKKSWTTFVELHVFNGLESLRTPKMITLSRVALMDPSSYHNDILFEFLVSHPHAFIMKKIVDGKIQERQFTKETSSERIYDPHNTIVTFIPKAIDLIKRGIPLLELCKEYQHWLSNPMFKFMTEIVINKGGANENDTQILDAFQVDTDPVGASQLIIESELEALPSLLFRYFLSWYYVRTREHLDLYFGLLKVAFDRLSPPISLVDETHLELEIHFPNNKIKELLTNWWENEETIVSKFIIMLIWLSRRNQDEFELWTLMIPQDYIPVEEDEEEEEYEKESDPVSIEDIEETTEEEIILTPEVAEDLLNLGSLWISLFENMGEEETNIQKLKKVLSITAHNFVELRGVTLLDETKTYLTKTNLF